jgi:hypothetical protein
MKVAYAAQCLGREWIFAETGAFRVARLAQDGLIARYLPVRRPWAVEKMQSIRLRSLQCVEESLFKVAVEHTVRGLVNEEAHALSLEKVIHDLGR